MAAHFAVLGPRGGSRDRGPETASAAHEQHPAAARRRSHARGQHERGTSSIGSGAHSRNGWQAPQPSQLGRERRQARRRRSMSLSHKVHKTVATGKQGGDITEAWSARTKTGVNWLTFDTGPLRERLFREASLGETTIDVGFLLNTQVTPAIGGAVRAARRLHEGRADRGFRRHLRRHGRGDEVRRQALRASRSGTRPRGCTTTRSCSPSAASRARRARSRSWSTPRRSSPTRAPTARRSSASSSRA